MNVKHRIPRDTAVNSSNKNVPGPAVTAATRVVIRSLHDVDLLAEVEALPTIFRALCEGA
jgi:hypothetical protein